VRVFKSSSNLKVKGTKATERSTICNSEIDVDKAMATQQNNNTVIVTKTKSQKLNRELFLCAGFLPFHFPNKKCNLSTSPPLGE